MALGKNIKRGRSPRARGSQRMRPYPRGHNGSIPACAGKPSFLGAPPDRERVDPRVRGEALIFRSWAKQWSGRSPRARGSLDTARHINHRGRSIPACAGKPSTPCATSCAGQVDPRVRGEASLGGIYLGTRRGRSPRARGSQRARLLEAVQARSIPACAGKPSGLFSSPRCNRVDPRVRGEAFMYDRRR